MEKVNSHVRATSIKQYDCFDNVILQFYGKLQFGYLKTFYPVYFLVGNQQYGHYHGHVDHHLYPVLCPAYQVVST